MSIKSHLVGNQIQFRRIYRRWVLIFLLPLFLHGCGGGSNEPGSATSANQGQVGVVAPPPNADVSAALLSGDSSRLNDPKLIAQYAQYALQEVSASQARRLADLYKGTSTEYDPTKASQWIIPINNELAQPLITGDKGNYLASISIANGGRSAAFGTQLLEGFDANLFIDYKPAFKRLMAWLYSGSPNNELPKTLRVAFVGLNAVKSASGMTKSGIQTQTILCEFLVDPACAKKVDLLIIGGEVAASSQLESTIRSLNTSGSPILYVHTKRERIQDAPPQILAGLGLKFGPYGGNWWTEDQVSTNRTEATNLEIADQFKAISNLTRIIASEKFDMNYDWAGCVDSVGKTDCSQISSLKSELIDVVDAVKVQINAFNEKGKNLFDEQGLDTLKYLVLWADTVRSQIKYPMDKTRTPVEFKKAYIADAFIAYVRKSTNAQADLGTFAGEQTKKMQLNDVYETIEVLIPSEAGFTAIGRMVAPGKGFSVEVVEAGTATVALRVNTQRTGSTRLWNPEKYDRPRFLASPKLLLNSGQRTDFVTPYGGTLQLSFSGATPNQKVTLRVSGLVKHPFLDLSTGDGDRNGFIAALNTGQFEWAEIKLPGIEVHTLVDKLKSVIYENNPTRYKVYVGNFDLYLTELKTLFFEDLYLLAGYALPGRQPTRHVLDVCARLNWDCTSSSIHRVPETQHINVDRYSQCGNGCSGNPYDQDWGLSPRGFGESHEVGHNQQKSMHKIYDYQSGEVSNNLFPLHKNWRMYRELQYNTSDNRVDYKSAFNMLIAAKQYKDPVEAAYQSIWSDQSYAANGSERLAFYIQWVHYWADRNQDEAVGWDLVTLLYMHQRLFDETDEISWRAQRSDLGYSTFAQKPKPTGNDNLLIVISWITQRDQRAAFDLWGIRYSEEASNQVQSFGFAKESAFFFANTSTNNHKTVKRIDMTLINPQWPF